LTITQAWAEVGKRFVEMNQSWQGMFEALEDPKNEGYVPSHIMINALIEDYKISRKAATMVIRDIDYDCDGIIEIDEWIENAEKFIESVEDKKKINFTVDELKEIHSLTVQECNKNKNIVKLMSSAGVFSGML